MEASASTSGRGYASGAVDDTSGETHSSRASGRSASKARASGDGAGKESGSCAHFFVEGRSKGQV